MNEGPHRYCRLSLKEQTTQVLINSINRVAFLYTSCNDDMLACIMIDSELIHYHLADNFMGYSKVSAYVWRRFAEDRSFHIQNHHGPYPARD